MSINNSKILKLHKLIIAEVLELSLVDSVKLFLNLKYPISKIANNLNVSRQAVQSTIDGKMESAKIKKAISKALGFNPWE